MMKLEELVSQLQLAYGDGLRSVVLFGSAVAGEHNPKNSDYNVLVIVDSLPLARLRAVRRSFEGVGRGWKSAADDLHRERMEIVGRHFPDGVRGHPGAASSAVRRSAIRWDSVAPSDLRLRSSSRRWESCCSCGRRRWARVATASSSSTFSRRA